MSDNTHHPKGSFWLGALGVLICVGVPAGWLAWEQYFSPKIEAQRLLQQDREWAKRAIYFPPNDKAKIPQMISEAIEKSHGYNYEILDADITNSLCYVRGRVRLSDGIHRYYAYPQPAHYVVYMDDPLAAEDETRASVERIIPIPPAK